MQVSQADVKLFFESLCGEVRPGAHTLVLSCFTVALG
jgi:hypothetical protein